MHRRNFLRATGIAGLGLVRPGLVQASSGTAFPPSGSPTGVAHRPPPRVDGERLNRTLAELARFGGTTEGGTSRVAYSDEDLAARAFVSGLLREAGLEVSVDGVGNLVGRRAGIRPNLRPLMLGSHIDSVPGGGNYDGQVGSMAAVEVARTLADHRLETRHPLELVIFQNEEGGKTGSRALVGEVEARELDVVTASGLTIREGIRRLGGDPDHLEGARRSPGDVRAFLELHVEQGAVLDRAGVRIGVVEGIVGIKRWFVDVRGFANHAGTTPMDQRRDAMVTAARIIQRVNHVARSLPGRQVATVGRLEVEPGAPNVIPGRVRFTLEVRDLSMDGIQHVFDEVEAAARDLAAQDGTEVTFDLFYTSGAAPTDEGIRRTIEGVADELGLTHVRLPSGAGHDAQSIARISPIGMIFVPSVDGISHSPLEHSRPEDVTAGADVLLGTLLALDADLDAGAGG